MSDYDVLYTPWKIKNLEIKNRIVMTSMGGTSIFGWMEPHHFDKEAANFLFERAKGGAGLILPGIAPIRNLIGGGWLYKANGAFKKLKPFMEEFHKTGAKMFVQLTAGFGRSMAVTPLMEKCVTNKVLGFLAKPFIDVDRLTASCSELPNRWSDHTPSRPLTIKEIQDMVDGFAKTALKCKEAGVDGVEVHAVHEGYLLDQFTLKYCNHRTDEYGGSLENRYRFATDIVKAIKKLCGEDYPVSLRYSVVSYTKGFRSGALPGEKYTEVGRDREESILAAQLLEKAGYDMLNCDNGTYDAWYWAHPPVYMPRSCNLEDCEFIRKHVNIPVVAAGKMEWSKGSKAIMEGKIDGFGAARPFLADAEWPNKLKEGKIKDIRPCIYCHNGCFTCAKWEGSANEQPLSDTAGMSRCAVNAETMQTKKHHIKKAPYPKSVAIIGGGIGGMECARVLALRGHKPVIYEKSDVLGGVYIQASNFSFKQEDKELLEWYRRQMEELHVEVRYKHEITDITALPEEEVIVATGAKPRKINIKGLDNGIEAIDFLKGHGVGHRVIIVGGGLTGCEIALQLQLEGKEPVIVEAKNDLVAVPGICLANTSYLREYFALHKVEVHLNSSVKEIEKGKVIISHEGKDEVLEGDDVIVSLGYVPAPISAPGAQLVGDCLKVGNLRHVIWRAYEAAMAI